MTTMTMMMTMAVVLQFPTYHGLVVVLNTIVFNYFDNPMRIFQDEETEAYLGVIAQDLGWPRGRARV